MEDQAGFLAEPIYWGSIEEGQLAGKFAYHVITSGQPATEHELGEIVMKINAHPGGNTKMVDFKGTFTKENSLDMLTLIQGLRGFGYVISLTTLGGRYYSYYDRVQWLTVVIGNEPWAAFPCKTLLYDMPLGEETEPPVPGDLTMTGLFVRMNPINSKQLSDFIKNADHSWGLWPTVRKAYRETI